MSGNGADLLDGGAGYEAAKSGVTIDLASSGAQDTGGAGADTLVDIEVVKGSSFNDVLSGGIFGPTALEGGRGDDILHASWGGSRLSGGEGHDHLYGGDGGDGGDGGEVIYALGGDDRIVGGAGDDRLFGGDGADTFAFDSRSGSDLIMDFNACGADHDVIAIQKNLNGSGIVDYASLVSHIQNIGPTDVRIDLGGGAYIGLLDVREVDLSSNLFVFY